MDATVSQSEIPGVYDSLSKTYDIWGKLAETRARSRAIELADINDGQHILEVAVGTGLGFYEIVQRNPNGANIGVDISPGMLQKAEKRLGKLAAVNYELKIGNAFNLEEETGSVDLLVNNYMFDLIAFDEMDGILEEFKRFQPEMFERLEKLVVQKNELTLAEYEQLPDISIDYAIMEKTAKGVVLPSEFGWSDIGSWKSLYEFLPKGDYNNVIDGDVIARNTENCFILGRDRLIATNHIKNMVVVETPDSIFVSDLDNSRDVKSIVESLQARGRREYRQHKTVHHPWGNTTILEQENNYTVKRIIVYPGSSAELYKDLMKIRHISVISGVGRSETATEKRILKQGDTIIVSGKEAVRIENSDEDLLGMIEVEMGRG